MPAQGGWSASAHDQTGCSVRSTLASSAMAQDRDNGYDAIFVGGGVIGLASAWRAAGRGARVCVLERDHPAAGATGVAAGMLAPAARRPGARRRFSPSTLNRCGAGRTSPDRARAGVRHRGGIRRARSSTRGARPRRGRGAASPLRAPPAARALLGMAFRTCLPRARARARHRRPRRRAASPARQASTPRRVRRAARRWRRAEVAVHIGCGGAAAEREGPAWRVETLDGRSFTGRSWC